MTTASLSFPRLSGSLKAEGFGDGGCRKSHPQAALEAATLRIMSLSTVEKPIKSKLKDYYCFGGYLLHSFWRL